MEKNWWFENYESNYVQSSFKFRFFISFLVREEPLLTGFLWIENKGFFLKDDTLNLDSQEL